jgi:hypothetical protein
VTLHYKVVAVLVRVTARRVAPDGAIRTAWRVSHGPSKALADTRGLALPAHSVCDGACRAVHNLHAVRHDVQEPVRRLGRAVAVRDGRVAAAHDEQAAGRKEYRGELHPPDRQLGDSINMPQLEARHVDCEPTRVHNLDELMEVDASVDIVDLRHHKRAAVRPARRPALAVGRVAQAIATKAVLRARRARLKRKRRCSR